MVAGPRKVLCLLLEGKPLHRGGAGVIVICGLDALLTFECEGTGAVDVCRNRRCWCVKEQALLVCEGTGAVDV